MRSPPIFTAVASLYWHTKKVANHLIIRNRSRNLCKSPNNHVEIKSNALLEGRPVEHRQKNLPNLDRLGCACRHASCYLQKGMTFGFNIVDLGFYKCTFIVYQYKLTTAVYYIFSCSITCLKKLIKKNYLYQSENITRKYDVSLLYLLKPLVTLVMITLATNFAFAICKTVKGRALLLRGGKGGDFLEFTT